MKCTDIHVYGMTR